MPPQRSSFSSSKATIAAACIATAMLMLDISVINTALSDMAKGLSTDLGGLQWVIDAYTLPLAATVLTAGALADRFGRRALFLAGLVVFTIASALCGAAPSIGALVASRAVQGLGASILFATGLALISQVTPTREERMKALAAWGAAVGASFAIGPFVGGALTEAFGWRAIFLVNVPIGVIALWIALTRVGEGKDPVARRVDVPGQLTLIAGLFLLVFGLLRGNEDGWGSAGIVAILAGGVAFLLGFVAVETRSAEPMLPLHLLRQRRFAGAQIAVFGMAASFFSIFVYMTIYLQQVLGRSPIETGLAYLPGTGLMFVTAGMAAQFGARFDSAKLASVGLGITGVGMALGLFAAVDSTWVVLLPSILISSFGCGLFNPAASELALQALPDEQSGLASGANDTFRQTGIALGIAALGTLVPTSTLGGNPQKYVDGFHRASIAAVAVAIVCAIGTWVLYRSAESVADSEPDAVLAAA